METADRLQQTFQRIFKDPGLKLNRTMTAYDIDGWDSVTNIKLVLALEKEFKIKILASEVIRLRNVGDVIDLIAKKTSA